MPRPAGAPRALSSVHPGSCLQSAVPRLAGARAPPIRRHTCRSRPYTGALPRHTHTDTLTYTHSHTHIHTPSPPGPAGDPSPFNHLAGAEEGLRHRTARNFPRGERGAQTVPVPRHAGSRRGGGGRDSHPSPPSPSSRPLPPHVPMHLLAEGGTRQAGASRPSTQPSPRPTAHSPAQGRTSVRQPSRRAPEQMLA